MKMEVVGRIDRVDKAEDESGTFLRIIDYKSSAKALNLTEVYYGLALQMLTYLDVVISNANTWMKKDGTASPAGVLYFHIHNPIVEMKGDASEEEIEREILKKFKMKGLVLGDTDVVRLMDNKLVTGSSDIISAGLKKMEALVLVLILQVSKSLRSCSNMCIIHLKTSEKTLQKV